MAASSLLALLDDIAGVLDDVALLTKAATRKTAGVLGDDLALNAQQVTGMRVDRELPVVWAVAKGSLVNKAMLVPGALAISAWLPWAVAPLMIAGGLFLCYEGFEKLAHRLARPAADDAARREARVGALADPAIDLVAFEKDRIKGAVRTDFVLSAEIIVITLGIVAGYPFATQVVVLTGIALAMTVGVYGLVAGIVKLDDAGVHLSRWPGPHGLARLLRALGAGIVGSAPYLMKALSVAGTAAMFLVGGGILTHGIDFLHHLVEDWARRASTLPFAGGSVEALTPTLLNAAAGVVAGAIVYAAARLFLRMRPAQAHSAAGTDKP